MSRPALLLLTTGCVALLYVLVSYDHMRSVLTISTVLLIQEFSGTQRTWRNSQRTQENFFLAVLKYFLINDSEYCNPLPQCRLVLKYKSAMVAAAPQVTSKDYCKNANNYINNKLIEIK